MTLSLEVPDNSRELTNLLAQCMYKLDPEQQDAHELLKMCKVFFRTSQAQSNMLKGFSVKVMFVLLKRNEVTQKMLADVSDVLILRHEYFRKEFKGDIKELFTRHLESTTAKYGLRGV